MGRATWASVFRQVCSCAAMERYLRMDDAELLGAFVTGLDEAAFEALLRRHGSMVFGVARRVLKNEADADDVFQATFLLLARKAGSIRKRQSVACWLHGVAHRLAMHERSRRARSHAVQRRAAEARSGSGPAPTVLSELQEVLDDVIARLPEKYRTPLVYCYLEGWTQEEIAQRMGKRIGTVRSWLARGRELLRKLLIARGVSLAAAPLASMLLACAATAASGSVPVRVIRATSRAARLLAGGAGAAQVVSGNVLHLLHEGMTIIVLAKLKGYSVCLLACVMLAAGAGWAAFQGAATNCQEPSANVGGAGKETGGVRHPTGADRDGEPLPAAALMRMGSARFRHEQWLEGVAIAPGGRRIAGVGANGLTIWDAATGRPLHRWTFPHQNWGLAFAPDGKSLVVGGEDSIVRLLDADTGKERRRFVGHTRDDDPFGPGILGVYFAGAGKRIVSWGTDKTVRMWLTDSGQELRRLGDKDWIVRGVSPDGRLGAFVKEKEEKVLRLWSAQFQEYKQLAHEATVRTVAFSPDNRVLAAAAGEDGQLNNIVVWDIRSGQKRWTLAGASAAVYALAFAPDGRTLVSGGADQTLRAWAVESGKELHEPRRLDSTIHHLAFRPDGRMLVIGLSQSVLLWEVATWKERRVDEGPMAAAESLAWSPSGNAVASTHGNQLWLWDSSTGKVLGRVESGADLLSILGYSADGRNLFTAGRDRTLHVRDAATGKVLRTVGREGRQAERMALSPDAKTVAAWGAGTASTIGLRDVGTGEELRQLEVPTETPPVKPTLYSVFFSRDGKTLYAGGGSNLAVLRWDVASGKLLPGIGKHDGGLNGVAMSPDQRSMAVVTMGGSLYVWELASGQARLVTNDAKYATSVVFSPDGRLLALTNNGSHCQEDAKGTMVWHIEGREEVRLVRVADGKVVRRLAGHSGGIHCAGFSADSTRLASAGDDTTVVVWDVRGAGAFGPQEAVFLTPEELPAVWAGLGGEAAAAFGCMGKLIAAPDQAIGLINAKLAPVHTADRDRVAALIKKLDSNAFTEREEATAELEKLGEAAEPGLRRALQENLPLESKRRIEKIIEDLCGLGHPSRERLRTLRAIEILERIASPEARQMLRRLADGADDAWLTGEAKTTLRRLGPTRISPLIGNPADS